MAQPAHQQAHTYEAVESDHDDSKDRVSPQRRIILTVQHARGNHRHLDGNSRERQNQRPVRLAKLNGKTVGMPHHTNCRPKNYGKKPEKDKRQQEWMPDGFHQARSSPEKDRRCSQANEQRKLTAYGVSEVRRASRWIGCLCLSRHEREHIECARVMQSADERPERSRQSRCNLANLRRNSHYEYWYHRSRKRWRRAG